MQNTKMGMFHAKCLSTTRLEGKTAIITGSNTGIGKETARNFFKRGARVILTCRSTEKANEAAKEIREACKDGTNVGELEVVPLDLSSLRSVRDCAKQLLERENSIDLLVNNAGVMVCPQGKTKDGFEIQFGTNHLGHFLFTLLLLPKIIKSAPSRIINVSSAAHARGRVNFDDLNFEKQPYSAMGAYCQSKLANVLFAKELARRINEANIEGVTVYSLHPGVVRTELGRHVDETYFWGLRMAIRISIGMFFKNAEQGAQTTIHCAVDERAGEETGFYYAECQLVEPSPEANHGESARKLWDVSLNLVELEDPFSIKT